MSILDLQYLAGKIDDELKVLADDAIMGKAKDHGDYKYACGIYRGLLVAKNMLIEAAERLED